jgi:glycosyltransferase involved in cell wall biosynthesis
MQHAPVVTVLLRVYNGERFLDEAIRSVLEQRFENFELLVIDDGSTDATPMILDRYIADPRVRVIRQANRGLSASTRLGVEKARGIYVAIMDADDWCFPDRLGKQVSFLEGNPDHVIVGSALQIIDENGRDRGFRRYPLDDESIREATVLYNPLGHPSVCFRRLDALACGNYTTEFETAEDFDFNVRLRAHGKAANFAEALVKYRTHGNAVKVGRLRKQLSETIRLRALISGRYRYRRTVRSKFVDIVQRALLLLPAKLVIRVFELAFYRSSPDETLKQTSIAAAIS